MMDRVIYFYLFLVVCVPAIHAASSPYPGWDINYYSPWNVNVSQLSSPDFFPISVWLQSPGNAAGFRGIGINNFIGQYNEPTTADLNTMRAANMPVWTPPTNTVRNYPAGEWWGPDQIDEPDNAQDNGNGGYDPCIDPSVIVNQYNQWKAADPSRPVYLSFGQGVVKTQWVGRGTCTGNTAQYAQYSVGADILSFDVYPVNNGFPLTDVADGIDNLYGWTNRQKPIWVWIEASNYNNNAPAGRPSQNDIYTEIWLALTHNARGYGFFCHQFAPTFIEPACLQIAQFANAIKFVNGRVLQLARALNSPTILQSSAGAVKVASSTGGIALDVLTKQNATGYYVLVVNRNTNSGSATFSLPSGAAASGTVNVLFDGRSVTASGGQFTDSFASYSPRTYFIATATGSAAATTTTTTTANAAATTTTTTTTTAKAATITTTTTTTAKATSTTKAATSTTKAATSTTKAATSTTKAATTGAGSTGSTTGSKPVQSLYDGTAAPTADADTASVTLGVKFTVSVAGSVTGIHVYRPSGTTITTGVLYNSAGVSVGSVTFPSSGSGWIKGYFTTPISIAANTQYTAAYFTPSGKYAAKNYGFSAARTVGSIKTPVAAGVYNYAGSAQFPTLSYQDSEYYVSPLFVAA